MSNKRNRKQRREHIKRRFRDACRGSAERPRLTVFRSLRHVYAQLIDDEQGKTLCAVSTLDKEVAGALEGTGNSAAGAAVGKAIAGRAKDLGVESVVFDRAGFPYHGVVKCIAEAAREAGLKF